MADVQENWPNIIEPILNKAFEETAKRFESMIPKLFSVSKSGKAEEHDLTYEGLDDFTEFTGVADEDRMYEGYKTDYEHKEYMKSVPIRRKLYLNDQYGIMKKLSSKLSLAAKRSQEKLAAGVFNNGFSTALADGKALCATDHPSKADGSYAGNNIVTSALSASAVETMRQKMAEFTDGRGQYINSVMDSLLTPIDLEETAWEIINTKGKVDTADNNRNFHEGRYQLAVWKYLTDPTNWFGMDSEMRKQELLWWNRVPLETYYDFNKKTQIMDYIGYYYCSTGTSGWRWVCGGNPA
jgi:phage major head subunit gpT-like protein